LVLSVVRGSTGAWQGRRSPACHQDSERLDTKHSLKKFFDSSWLRGCPSYVVRLVPGSGDVRLRVTETLTGSIRNIL